MTPDDPQVLVDSARWIPSPGDDLDGRYRIIERMASGGMGVVLRAEHVSLSRPVAVKVLRPKWSKDTAMAERFKREVQVAKSFSHPHIVRMYDYGRTSEGCLYLVMEWLEGLDLAEVLYREGGLKLGRALNIWQQILDGLAEAHSLGVIHRDLKPANAFVTRDRRGREHVTLLDFGIAKPIETEQELTRTGQLCGTVPYMAPEMILEEDVGKPADIYSATLLFLELLTGEPVIFGESAIQMIYHQLNTPIPIPEPLENTPLEYVLRRALQKHPDRRFADADALLDALEEIADDIPEHLEVDAGSARLVAMDDKKLPGNFLSTVDTAGVDYLDSSGSSGVTHDSSELFTRKQTGQTVAQRPGQRRDEGVFATPPPGGGNVDPNADFGEEATVLLRDEPDHESKYSPLNDDTRPTRVYDTSQSDDDGLDGQNRVDSENDVEQGSVRSAGAKPGLAPEDQAYPSPASPSLGPSQNTARFGLAQVVVGASAAVVVIGLIGGIGFFVFSGDDDSSDGEAAAHVSAVEESGSEPDEELPVIQAPSYEEADRAERDELAANEDPDEERLAEQPEPEQNEPGADESSPPLSDEPEEEQPAEQAAQQEQQPQPRSRPASRPARQPSPTTRAPEPDPEPEPDSSEEDASDADAILDRYFQD